MSEKKYPTYTGKVYTEKKKDKDGREYHEFVCWKYTPRHDAEQEARETKA